MKAIVNSDTCIGCGLCTSICPSVFSMAGAVAEVIATPVPTPDEPACSEAVESCPVAAITLSE